MTYIEANCYFVITIILADEIRMMFFFNFNFSKPDSNCRGRNYLIFDLSYNQLCLLF